jgi:hypothetical protein
MVASAESEMFLQLFRLIDSRCRSPRTIETTPFPVIHIQLRRLIFIIFGHLFPIAASAVSDILRHRLRLIVFNKGQPRESASIPSSLTFAQPLRSIVTRLGHLCPMLITAVSVSLSQLLRLMLSNCVHPLVISHIPTSLMKLHLPRSTESNDNIAIP